MKWGILVLFLAEGLQAVRGDEIELPNLGIRQPIYLTQHNEFWPLNIHYQLVFQNGDIINVYCQQGFNNESITGQMLRLTYINKTFMYKENPYVFNALVCTREANVASERLRGEDTRGECKGFDLYNIGYRVSSIFLPVYQICYDTSVNMAKYSKNVILTGTYGINPFQCTFRDVHGFDNMTRYYTQLDMNFDKGHLSPKGDFLYSAQKIATCSYPNIAAQSKRINNLIWSALERFIRSEKNDRTFVCYTGVLRVTDVNGADEEQFLNVVERKIPFPMYYFKVVHHPDSKTAVVLIAYNNMYEHIDSDRLCINVSSQLIRKFRNLNVHACEYNDFRRTMNANYLPELDVDGLLFTKINTAM